MNTSNKKIAFYLFSVNGRGQSKIMIDIAGGLAHKGYEVIFFYTRLDNDVFARKYGDVILFKKIDATGRVGSIFKLRNIIRFDGFDVFVTAGNDNNCSIIMAKFGLRLKTRFIITEHNSLSQVVANSRKPFIGFLKVMVRWLYRLSDALVSVSYGIKNELDDQVRVKHKKSIVIYNPVIDRYLEERSFEVVNHKWLDGSKRVFLGVGRLSIQKSFDDLIKAFSLVVKNDENYRLIILGDGEDKNKLQNLIDDLKVGDKVDLFGRVDNPYSFMRKANVFVLSSKFEGLPTVLVEAMACNLSIVSTNCPHGPAEILENGKWGRLVSVGDVTALAEAMDKAMNEHRFEVAQRARAFSFEDSINEYEKLINELTGEFE